MPSYSPAIAFRRFSSSTVASRPGLNSRPVDMPSAPDSMASRMKPSIVAACSSVGCGPEMPAAVRSALWPTNHARLGECPTAVMKSRCSERAPGDERAVEAERVEALGLGHTRVVGHRGVARTAVADDLGRDSLPDRALGVRVREEREVGVAVRVDEAGADDIARSADN